MTKVGTRMLGSTERTSIRVIQRYWIAAAPRGIGGVLATVNEITSNVITERRVGIVSELGTRLAEANTDVDVCVTAAEILGQQPRDVPFALLYLMDEDGHTLRLAGRTGIDGSLAGPEHLDLAQGAEHVRWPLAEALRAKVLEPFALPRPVANLFEAMQRQGLIEERGEERGHAVRILFRKQRAQPDRGPQRRRAGRGLEHRVVGGIGERDRERSREKTRLLEESRVRRAEVGRELQEGQGSEALLEA